MRKLFVILVALTALTLAPAASALHQAGPNINCVAVIYDDFTVGIAAWADVADLARGPMVKLVVFHDQGSSSGPNQVGFVGTASYAVFLQGPNLLVRAVDPLIGEAGTAKERLFRPDGTQTGTIDLAAGQASTAAVAADALFTSINPVGPTYTSATDTANALDIVAQVGLCSPAQ